MLAVEAVPQMHDGIGAPRTPTLGVVAHRRGRGRQPERLEAESHAEILRGERVRSLRARIETYATVHGPMPRTARSRSRVTSRSAAPDRSSSPDATSSATRRRVASRAVVRPSPSSALAASCSAVGNRWSTSPTGRSSGVPYASAIRPANVRAARTLICCPRIARTTSSNPSAVPGSRRPGVVRTSGRSEGSKDSAVSTIDGSASRSSKRRAVAESTEGSMRSEDPKTRRRTSPRSGCAASSITAALASGWRTARRNVVPSNDSTPGIVRSPRNRKSASAARGGAYGRRCSINSPAPATVPHAP